MDQDTKDILAAVNFIKDKVEQLPTKDDVRAIVREEIDNVVPGIVVLELAPVRAELKEIRKDIATLQEQVASHAGYAKEIDHALERIAAMEKHLGLDQKVAA